MHPNCRRGSLPKMRGSRLSAVPFCISILTSVRRIIKIAVRFLHTKTALCDRKDTQSRFAVNAARSIVCVETLHRRTVPQLHSCFNAARSIVCVETATHLGNQKFSRWSFNAARSIVCVETPSKIPLQPRRTSFQCRTQHCVCRDNHIFVENATVVCFNAARSIVCVETVAVLVFIAGAVGFNAARSIVCVETPIST